MKVAYTMANGRGDTDLVLERLAQSLIATGKRVVGVVQINTERETCHHCDMDVKILPDGPVVRISQNLGAASKGCRLDTNALESVVVEVGKGLNDEVDILILNKFGKHEADGRGFRDLIADALGMGVPVVTGVNDVNRDAFQDFAGGMAEEVAPNVEALQIWINSPRKPNRQRSA